MKKNQYHYSKITVLTGLMLLLSFSGFAQVDLNNGLVAYYSFNDGTAVDSSMSQNHGILNGAPSQAPGIICGALSFDGVDDFVTIPTGLNFNQDFTISFWIKPYSLGTIVNKGENCPNESPNYLGHSYSLGLGAKYDGCYDFINTSFNHFNTVIVEPDGNFFNDRIFLTTESPAVDTGVYYYFCTMFF